MSQFRYSRSLSVLAVTTFGIFALMAALSSRTASAEDGRDGWRNPWEIKHVFVIAMENHNWTQPTTLPNDIQPVFQNPNAPFI
jgi:hypothetical protein